ncbi:hypothetical protein [Bacillus pseudomycoides]|uniref:hypothetical protein n=1 Tax=Bacillus pseudomycoides TaxID=64104 RepID=UPI0023DAD03E|nr:hypothetical protein [Bacillus pseudomycoides]MDF2083910.1 hypothetical protein [Bacillus pseudomycoides]
MKNIENNIVRYNELKIDLLNISKCIETCEECDKEFYQDIAIQYSKRHREMKKFIEKTYNIKICECCSYEKGKFSFDKQMK